ncbi:MAG TPA: helix-turn-helix domain-containing protein [Polyangiaceae bacterium]|nr:helix-turn-helix domain-containing protein [Polyangiaceae bacterium]
MDESRTQRHYAKGLPRSWVVLPLAVRRRALDDSLLSGLFPSHVGFFPAAREHRIVRSAGLTSTIFNYCVQGSGFCTVAGKRHEVRSGELAVVPAGEPHAYGTNADDPWTLHWFHAMGANVPRLLARLGVTRRAPVVELGRSAELEALFDQVRETLEEDYGDESLLEAALTLSHLIGVMLRLRRDPHAELSAAERVRASLASLKGRLAEAHDVKRLASQAELSPSRFSELVRRACGAPPMAYLTRLRVERATELLASTDLTVKAIAREVGFADPLHFSRVFRRVSGKSPGRQRARRNRVSSSGVRRP